MTPIHLGGDLLVDQSEASDAEVRCHIIGRPLGAGSRYICVFQHTGKFVMDQQEHWKPDEAVYHGIWSVLNYLSRGSSVRFLTCSQPTEDHFAEIIDRPGQLGHLLARIRYEARQRNITVIVEWIPRAENLAYQLLVASRRVA